MTRTDSLFGRINQKYGSLSKGQKKLADYMLAHVDQAVFLTAEKLGQQVGVSESTTVRFAMALGYDGFPQFQEAQQALVRHRLTAAQKKDETLGALPGEELLDAVLQEDLEHISQTLAQIDREAFCLAVETLLEAETIYVIGIRSCAPLAAFLCFYLNQIFPRVVQVSTTNTSEILEQMLRVGERDAVIGISFPRYSMRTLKAMEFANNRNAKVITITDSIHSPMNLYSSCNLIAASHLTSIVDSLVAPLSVINALITALCGKRRTEVMRNLKNMEEIWTEYQVYAGDEIDLLREDS